MASKLAQDIGEAIDAANRAGTGGPADSFILALADRVGIHASVRAVFGDPIERDGLVVVPVAKVRWGFGGGAGGGSMAASPSTESAPDASAADGGPTASGEGGGGGVTADPIGWLEIGPDGAEFRPIVPAMPSPGFLLAAGVTAAMLLRALARLLRG